MRTLAAFRRTVSFLSLFLALGPLVSPQEEPKLSLERVRELALANSRTLAKYNLTLKDNALDEKLLKYNDFPGLSLGLSASASLWNAQGGAGASIQDSITAGASVSVSQSLWDGGKNSLQKAIAAMASDITRQDALAEFYAVLDGADGAYYGALEAAAALEAAEASLETAVHSLRIAEIRQVNNMISAADYLQALAEKENRETARNQARRDLALGKTKLRNITGLERIPVLVEEDFGLWAEVIEGFAALDDEALDDLYGKLRQAVSLRNPGLIKAGLSSRRAEKSTDLSRRDYFPRFSASLSSGLNYGPDRGLEYSAGRLSLSASIPLDYHVIGAAVEKRKVALESAALDMESAGLNLALEVETALLDLVSQAQSALSSARAWEYARKNLEYNLELYQLSRNSLSDLSGAEALVRNNRTQMIRSQYGFLRGLSRIRGLGAFETIGDFVRLAGFGD
jgi:outer membrane protein TolC